MLALDSNLISDRKQTNLKQGLIMNAIWQRHLEHEGAHLDASRSVNFSDESTEIEAIEGAVIADLSHLGLLRVHGTDARDFLQGQFSNDLRQVDATHSQLSAYCSPKGRILTGFRLFMREDAFYLVLPCELLEATLKRLRMFVLRSQVVLEEANDTLVAMGVAGAQVDTLLRPWFTDVPTALDSSRTENDITALRLSDQHAPRYMLFAPPEQLVTLWTALRPTTQAVGTAAWRMLDIRAGIPLIQSATVEAFVPQMVNYQLIGGVSFKKGCYPGQEVVARMQYLGKLKRRMYRARIDHDDTLTPPRAGDDLYDARGDGQSAGKIVDAQALPTGGYESLAVIQIAAADGGELRLHSRNGVPIHLQTLPYALDQAG